MKKQILISDNLNTFLFGALAFSVSSAWNSVLQNYFKDNKYFKNRGPLLYAFVVSVFAIVCAFLLNEATEQIKIIEYFFRNKTNKNNNGNDSNDDNDDDDDELLKLKHKKSRKNNLSSSKTSQVAHVRNGKHVTLNLRKNPFHT
jgi:hypothetical protein